MCQELLQFSFPYLVRKVVLDQRPQETAGAIGSQHPLVWGLRTSKSLIAESPPAKAPGQRSSEPPPFPVLACSSTIKLGM